jgi:hypothetical protein
MLNYNVKVEGYEVDGKVVYHSLKITDLTLMDCREIKVRYSTLLDLHSQL